MNPRPTAYEAAALTGLSYRGAGEVRDWEDKNLSNGGSVE